jgi:predicted dehydrogenase
MFWLKPCSDTGLFYFHLFTFGKIIMYKFAIIGCGRIARKHAENISSVGILVATCDVVLERAIELAHKYDANSYASLDDLLLHEKDVDVISVCTPNGFHAEHAIKSLQSGKHVLCEKPLSITSAAAWQMMETEKFSRRKIFIVKSTRYNPLLQSLKQALDKDLLGTVYSFQLSCFWNRPHSYYTDWRGKIFPDGGTLYTQFSHYIDALLWLLGDIKEVKGFSANKAHEHSIEFEDTGVASLQMKNGALGTLNWSVNTYKKNSEISLTLISEKGTIALGGEYLNEIKFQQTDQPILMEKRDAEPNDYGFYKGSMSNHKEVYQNLVQALEDDKHPFTNAFDGLKTVEAIEQIYKAVKPQDTFS